MSARRLPAPQSADPIEPDGASVRVGITGGTILVSVDDYRLAKMYRWRVGTNGYPRAWVYNAKAKRGRTIELHRLICWVPDGVVVDHKNCDRLDARRENLRPASPRENGANKRKTRKPTTSQFLGVTKHSGGKWQAGAKHLGRFYHCGLHATEEAAAHARDERARALWGEFAPLNFPDTKRAA